ncbi:glycoside hydrolase family 13 protein [Saccharibacillus kuerlensis]|uniref:Alpha-glucosidase n=1 Tax=Saccharibacillus kuerlensis TaxID=459527 RepID=A0ABQ2L2U9_9BACL|nr:alpha-glucosidase [Saccharibacillus kuerlensis]GGO00701.1 alpha-glucosidase [Saccharibacillus kuerlensis]
MMTQQSEAWKEKVVYQIFPRSFQDSNGDGNGDIPGIISRLDYIKSIGVDTIWLSPVYESPRVDQGYDITNHREIDPMMGTMEDWERLLEEVHGRGMDLWMDLVLNHTSDEHRWFKRARSSKDNPYRDYYIWRPGEKDGEPPNNWTSYLGGSAWTYDEASGEYYLHLYNKKQPDLNWDNPKVREEIQKMVRYWLDKGVNGFRLDAINVVSKDSELPDTNESKLEGSGYKHFKNGPNVHKYLRELNEKGFSHKEGTVTVGEASMVSMEDVSRYTDPERKELNMIFMMESPSIGTDPDDSFKTREWTLPELKEIVTRWEKELVDRGWFGLFASNHDHARMVSHFGDDGKYWAESAKMLATLVHTLWGTPFIYQGEEIGMTDYPFESIDQLDDQMARHYYDFRTQNGEDPQEVERRVLAGTRDHARTPMQWDDSEHAGFTTGKPWMPVHPNYREINVHAQEQHEHSILNYYRKLIAMRREHADVIVHGEYVPLLEEHEQVFAYIRRNETSQGLVLLNFSDQKAEFELPEDVGVCLESAYRMLGNYPPHTEGSGEEASGNDSAGDDVPRVLRPYEAIIFGGLKPAQKG